MTEHTIHIEPRTRPGAPSCAFGRPVGTTARHRSGTAWRRTLAFLLLTCSFLPAATPEARAQQTPLELIIGQVSPSPLSDEERAAFPEKAKIVVVSPVPNLRFSNPSGDIQRLPTSEPDRHILLVDPTVQLIQVRSPGFAPTRFRVPVVQPGEARHYQIKPITPELDEGRGNLTLITNPVGATLQLQGPYNPRATTPYQFLNQEAGAFRVQIDAPNHKTLIRRLRVKEGESLVEYLELEPDFGYLRVTARDGAVATQAVADPRLKPEWVEPPSLRVDAVDPEAVLFGVGEPKEGFLTVREGVHLFNLSAPGYLDATIEVQIESGAETVVAAPMEQRYGWLDLLVTDTGGRPVENLTPVIPATALPADVPDDRPGIVMNAGVHAIRLQAPGFE